MHFSRQGNKFDPVSYKRSNLLKIKDLCFIQNALFTFDFENSNLPDIFENYLSDRIQQGHVITRGNHGNYYQEFTGTKYAEHCIKSASVKAWSKVPRNLKDCQVKHLFKKHLKRHILNTYVN